MPLSPEEQYLAEKCYGYGRWGACYWFIGPEQGMGNGDYDDEINRRYKAFVDLQSDGLCDCRSFHEHIGGNKHFPRDPSQKVALQKTWGYQIELLYAYNDKHCSPAIRRGYQFDHLGNSKGDTCIVELRGLPAKSASLRKDQTAFLSSRIEELSERIVSNSPKFVVFYGSEQSSWSQIAKCDIKREKITPSGNTLFAYMPHPNARNELQKKHADWEAIGKAMRLRSASAADHN